MVPHARSVGRGALVGASAGAAATLVLLVVRATAGGPSLPELVQDAVVGLIPGPLFSFVLDRLKFAGKPLLFTLLVVLPVLGAGFLGTGRSADAPVWLSTLVGGVTCAAVLHALSHVAAASEAPDADRRRLVRLAAGGGALAAVGLVGWRVLPLLPLSGSRATAPPALVPAPTNTRAAGGPSAVSGDDHPTPDITPVG